MTSTMIARLTDADLAAEIALCWVEVVELFAGRLADYPRAMVLLRLETEQVARWEAVAAPVALVAA